MEFTWQSRIDILQTHHKNTIFFTDAITEESFSYGELFVQTRFIYDAIKTSLPGELIGLMLTKPSHYLPCLLACWQAGCTAVILDPETTEHRFEQLKPTLSLAYVLKDSTKTKQPSNVTCLNILELERTANLQQNIRISLSEEESPALILFSSGTTGAPKCIPLSLRNIAHNILCFKETLGISGQESFLSTSPLYYAHGLYNGLLSAFFLMKPIVYGFPLNLLTAKKILATAKKHQSSIYHITPSMIPILVVMGTKAKEIIPRINSLICGTAKLEKSAKLTIEDLFDTPVIQQYGMTETLFMTMTQANKESALNALGQANFCQLKVVDDNNSSLPTGTIGNIIVHSASCFGSYYQQVNESQLAFKDGWFLTGDLGYLNEFGELFLAGRKKQLIKKAGVNINPNEINDVLNKHPKVIEAITIGIPDKTYGEEIISFISSKTEVSIEELHTLCKAHLVLKSRPKNIIKVADFPRTKSGKIKISALKGLL